MAKIGGPTPLPTALKVLNGVRKDRINLNEPQPPAVLPEPPRHLDAVAKRKWRELAPVLHSMGVLTEPDIDAFTLLCSLHSKAMECEREFKKDGLVYDSKLLGKTKVSLHWKVYMECVRALEALYSHFGMTPSSRSRIQVNKDQKPKDEFEAFMAETG